jgi:hypothetical protein
MPNSWIPRAHSGMRCRAIRGSGRSRRRRKLDHRPAAGARHQSRPHSHRDRGHARVRRHARERSAARRDGARAAHDSGSPTERTGSSPCRTSGCSSLRLERAPCPLATLRPAPHHGCHLASSLSICHGARHQSVEVERWQERADAVSSPLEDVWRTPRARALFALPRRRLATGLRRKRAPRLALLTLSLRTSWSTSAQETRALLHCVA